MNSGISRLIDRFAGLKVAVVGEGMLDSYLAGTTKRLCQEAPVPVVALNARSDCPGGAANVAVNVAALGGRAEFLSVIGRDLEGEILAQALEERGISTGQLIAEPARHTLTKHRVVADGQMLVRFDQGSTTEVAAESERALTEALKAAHERCDALIVSDYAYGVVTPRVIRALAELQARDPRVLVVDSKRLVAFREAGVTAVKPNYGEALHLLGLPDVENAGARVDRMTPCGERLLELCGAQIAALTLDIDGALFFERGRPTYRTFAQPVPNSRAAGAGDTFVAALALALAAGATTPEAAELASSAAEVVTGKEGTAACFGGELREHLSAPDKYYESLDRLMARLAFYREQGRRIVLTNGCFDILHRGHITYLNRAKALGDVLVLGVNTDEGIRRLKGPSRPINTLDDRVQVLSALSCVDHIVAFDEETPCELVRAIRPHVFVKGGDYTRERLPEASLVEQFGGEVRILPFVADRSTTGLIERIRRAQMEAPAC